MVGLTVNCSVTCVTIGFLGLVVVGFGCIVEKVYCAVVTTVVITSSFMGM